MERLCGFMDRFSDMPLSALLHPDGFACDCGRAHGTPLRLLKIGAGAVKALPEALAVAKISHPFILCDENTARVGLAQVRAELDTLGLPYACHRLRGAHIEPDELAVGSAAMAFDPNCDGVLAIGSGVVNDIAKIIAHAARRPQIVVATAPSMDGYASNSSSMIAERLKTTLYNSCPIAILADTDILREAPERMLWAGLGDILAKYIALCDWRIAHLVTGEYFCENIAGLVRRSVRRVVDNADRLMQRDPEAVEAVTEGLILSGVAMSFAQVSRPASGLEHYFSHIWEMMALDRGRAFDLHGIQVGVGTRLALGLYAQIRHRTPSREAAEAAYARFDHAAWEAEIRRVFGKAADSILAVEEKAQQNAPEGHARRLDAILAHWPQMQAAMEEELPTLEALDKLMRGVGMPMTPADLGLPAQDVRDAFVHSRDLRDKYMLSSLIWDLGWMDTVTLG
jgi:glycerol-1-phosphate dehydrogenase [NAD(P)+]